MVEDMHGGDASQQQEQGDWSDVKEEWRPKQSLELNPKEHLWRHMKFTDTWHSICEKLVNTYPERFGAVTATKGGFTQYWNSGVNSFVN